MSPTLHCDVYGVEYPMRSAVCLEEKNKIVLMKFGKQS